jgi:two-component system phosphate regulon sensor histidine kinase PhoR
MVQLAVSEAGARHTGLDKCEVKMTTSAANSPSSDTLTLSAATTDLILRETFTGLILVDREGCIVTMNPSAEAMTGHRTSDSTGHRLGEVLGLHLMERDGPVGFAMSHQQRISPTEVTIPGPDGPREVLLGVVPMPEGYLLSMFDITHFKELDRLKSEFVAHVSHELRTPLASIKAYTELLLDELDEGNAELRRRFLQIINQETDRLADLISELLDLARLEAGTVQAVKRPIRLDAVVHEVCNLLEVQARERNVQLRVKIPDVVSELTANRDMMLTLVKNLVDNAVKFNQPDGSVEVSLVETPEAFRLEVADQGIGIPSEAIPRLFSKFFRVQSSTESGIQGSGLGLALVKQAVDAHAGKIEVNSQVGEGTRFTVILPKGSSASATKTTNKP